MTDYIDSHYSRTRIHLTDHPTLQQNIETDVLVIGAGLAGLSTCLEVSRSGQSCVLIDKNRVAWGASGRNGGLVMPGFAADPQDIANKVGLNHAKELLALSANGAEAVRTNIKKLNIKEAQMVESGVLAPARYSNEKALKHDRDWIIENLDWSVEYKTSQQLGEMLRTDKYHQGLFFSHAFHFHPLNYALALAKRV